MPRNLGSLLQLWSRSPRWTGEGTPTRGLEWAPKGNQSGYGPIKAPGKANLAIARRLCHFTLGHEDNLSEPTLASKMQKTEGGTQMDVWIMFHLSLKERELNLGRISEQRASTDRVTLG